VNEAQLELCEALSKRGNVAGPTPAGLAGHDVVVYRAEEALIRSVVEFLSTAVRVGQPIIVIATPTHRREFLAGLRAGRLDPEEHFAGSMTVWLDARETLDSFMEGSLPSRELFLATVGSVFERLLDKRQYLIVRAFGEMVDLLWKDGNIEGAILLEQLWNELALKYKYSLLCAYSIDNFVHEAGVAAFRRVCDHHTNAFPLDVVHKNVA
jgi:hypothetical protein